jgi:hypothetical protein
MHDGDFSVWLERQSRRRRQQQVNGFILESLPPRRKGNPFSIGREIGMSIGSWRMGQTLQVGSIRSDSVNLIIAVPLARPRGDQSGNTSYSDPVSNFRLFPVVMSRI